MGRSEIGSLDENKLIPCQLVHFHFAAVHNHSRKIAALTPQANGEAERPS